MKYELVLTGKFKKGLKHAKKRDNRKLGRELELYEIFDEAFFC